jgi:hypothetical protein
MFAFVLCFYAFAIVIHTRHYFIGFICRISLIMLAWIIARIHNCGGKSCD